MILLLNEVSCLGGGVFCVPPKVVLRFLPTSERQQCAPGKQAENPARGTVSKPYLPLGTSDHTCCPDQRFITP